MSDICDIVTRSYDFALTNQRAVVLRNPLVQERVPRCQARKVLARPKHWRQVYARPRGRYSQTFAPVNSQLCTIAFEAFQTSIHPSRQELSPELKLFNHRNVDNPPHATQ